MLKSCPISNKRISKNATRINALFNILLLLSYFFSAETFILYFLTLDFAIKAVTPVPSPLSYLAFKLIELFKIDPHYIDALPKKFAMRLGFIVLLIASLLSVSGFEFSAQICIYLFITLTFFEFAFGFCMGCYIYTFYLTLVSSSKAGKITRLSLFILSFFALFILTKILIYDYTKEQSFKEIQIILEIQMATRNYIHTQQKQVIQALKESGEITKDFYNPVLMSSSYITRNIHENYNKNREKKHKRQLSLKVSAKNPLNPINSADAFERSLLNTFNTSDIKEYHAIKMKEDKEHLYVALPTEKISQKCLKCHGNPKDAPNNLVKRYGDSNGFSQKIGDIPAILSIYMPLSNVIATSSTISYTIFFVMLSIFILIYFIVEIFIKTIQKKEALALSFQQITQEQKVKLQHMNDELLVHKENLQERVEVMVLEYDKSQEILLQQSKLASMGEMLASISHQWKQPISVIQTVFSNIELDEALDSLQDDAYQKGMHKVKQQVHFMLETMDDFKNFLRPDKTTSDFELLEGVNEIFHLFRIQYKLSGLQLVVKQNEKVKVHGYYNEYRQVILNLICNAQDAYNEMKIDKKLILVSLYKEDDFGVIEIEDKANGIPEKLLTTIFEPYFTTKKEDIGTGIGLYMAKTIIETNMKGELTVHNSKEGAVFKIKLPLA